MNTAARMRLCRHLREKQTPAEEFLWELLRDRRLHGLKFRRQHPLGRFVADFYCPTHRLALELDGGVHDEQTDDDQARDAAIAELDVRVLRLRNEDLLAHPDRALKSIADAIRRLTPDLPVSPSPVELERGPGGEALILPGTAGPRELRASAGRRLLLIFYQEDSTPACSAQVRTFRDDYELIDQLGAEAVAISSDTLDSHHAFAERLGPLPFPLLSDPEGRAAMAFGVWEADIRRARRSVFVVNDQGQILHAVRQYSAGNLAAYEGVFAALGFEGESEPGQAR